MYIAYTTLRHIFELLAANLIFFTPAAKRRRYFWLRFSVGFVVLCSISVPLYMLVTYINAEFSEQLSWNIGQILSGTTINYYIFYILIDIILMTVHFYICYDVTVEQLLFLSLAARAVDLIKGVIFYLIEFNAFGNSIEQSDTATIIIYAAIRMIVVAAYYVFVYYLIPRRWQPEDNYQLIGKAPSIIVYTAMIFVLFVTNTIIMLLLYTVEVSLKYAALVIEAFFGAFVLITQVSIHLNNKQKIEKHILNNMMQERSKQYLVSKENMEIINRKYHDLKHQISALKALSSSGGGGEASVKEIEQSLSMYDAMIKTGNEILDTLLTEKSLYCAQKEIQFNYHVDSRRMEFLDAVDLYTMLGNALDNAIEAVERLDDEKKRLINLSVENNEVMLMIQIVNYSRGGLRFSGDLPRTTKQDGNFHGFGIKSIKAIAEKYKGNIKIEAGINEIFSLTIGIPLP